MKKENKIKLLINWLDEIWEEIEIQFYGIIGALSFFISIYFVFHPTWMKPLIDFFSKIKLSL
tara:strand:+ start:443 stop:628 length:186 start_codon:yes stop_codon:yes gene_type:complete